MRKNKKFLMICAILAGMGFALAGAGIAMGGIVHGFQINAEGIRVYAPQLEKNSKNGKTRTFESAEESLEAFDCIEIDAEYADIRVEQSDSSAYTLAYNLSNDERLQKEVKDGKLILKQKEEPSYKNGFINMSWFFIGDFMDDGEKEYVTVGLPQDAVLKEVQLDTESGDIVCDNIQADSLQIKAEYGDVSLSDAKAQKMEMSLESGKLQMEQVQGDLCSIQAEYGNVYLDQVFVSGDMTLQIESGNLRLQDTYMQQLYLKSEYGNVDGQRAEFAGIRMELDSGDCQMQNVLFDNCTIRSVYGDVEMELKKDLTDYAYELETEYGTVKVDGHKMGESYVSIGKESDDLIDIRCESGDIRIDAQG